jgi:ferrous iron transport protein B
MMIPFMSCNARLPVFILIISAFFPEKYHSLTLFSIYIIWVIVSIITGAGLNKLMKWQRTPILLELPRYQYPRIKEILLYGWKPTKSFLVKAWKIVIPISIVLWVLFSFPRIDGESVPAEDTYAASVGKTIWVIFEPLWYDWKLSTGLVAWFWAKEIMVSTLGTIYAIEEDNEDGLIETFRSDPNMNIWVALSLIIFVLLYAPCMTVFWVMKEQIWWKWALISITYSTVLWWILAFIIYQSYLIIV